MKVYSLTTGWPEATGIRSPKRDGTRGNYKALYSPKKKGKSDFSHMPNKKMPDLVYSQRYNENFLTHCLLSFPIMLDMPVL